MDSENDSHSCLGNVTIEMSTDENWLSVVFNVSPISVNVDLKLEVIWTAKTTFTHVLETSQMRCQMKIGSRSFLRYHLFLLIRT